MKVYVITSRFDLDNYGGFFETVFRTKPEAKAWIKLKTLNYPRHTFKIIEADLENPDNSSYLSK